MALRVEVYQKEKVRPSSPTPETFRIHKLSYLDKIAAGGSYLPNVLFYGAGPRRHDYDELKESLSKTLSILYPLAGRLKDGSMIECNDEGADFVRANVTNYDLAEFLRHPKLEDLRQLLPLDPYPNAIGSTHPMLAVQVNRFLCGGTAVAFCAWHGVVDGVGMTGIFDTLTAINRGEEGATNAGRDLVVDTAAIFSPGKNLDSFLSSMPNAVTPKIKTRRNYTTKIFVFSKQDIERIRSQCNNQSEHRRPSQVEALSAFIWAAIIRATQLANPIIKTHLLLHSMNFRKKLNPPLPWQCLGNITQATLAKWEVDEGAGKQFTAQSLVGRIVKAINKVTNEYVREMCVEGGFLKYIISLSKHYDNKDDTKILGISSMCKIPFHEVDFGWGKPIWIGLAHKLEDMAIFLDTKDGEVEVWIGLEHEVMRSLEKDMEFHAYVSYAQIIYESSLSQRSAL